MSGDRRRRLRPQRGEPSSKKTWESVSDEDLVLPVPEEEEEEEEEGVYEASYDEGEGAYAISDEGETELTAALVVPPPGVEVGELASGSEIEALCARGARHALVSRDEAIRTVDGEAWVVARFADEVEGASSAALWRAARSRSSCAAVRDLKKLASEASRPPAWKADLARELDDLAAGCAARSKRLDGLRVAREAFEHRLETARAALADEPPSSEKARAAVAAERQVRRRLRQIDDLILGLGERDDHRHLLDSILAMILLRHHRPPAVSEEAHCRWLLDTHDRLVQAWRADLGLLPVPEDAIRPAQVPPLPKKNVPPDETRSS